LWSFFFLGKKERKTEEEETKEERTELAMVVATKAYGSVYCGFFV
jgi:hypothetical protein